MVDIVGSGIPQQVRCRFGVNSTYSGCAWISSTLGRCTSPMRKEADEVTVECNLYGKEAGQRPFLYFLPCKIVSILPSAGYEAGGSSVRVVGYNFIVPFEPYFCIFGASIVDGIYLSSSAVECKSSTHAPGAVVVHAVGPAARGESAIVAQKVAASAFGGYRRAAPS